MHTPPCTQRKLNSCVCDNDMVSLFMGEEEEEEWDKLGQTHKGKGNNKGKTKKSLLLLCTKWES